MTTVIFLVVAVLVVVVSICFIILIILIDKTVTTYVKRSPVQVMVYLSSVTLLAFIIIVAFHAVFVLTPNTHYLYHIVSIAVPLSLFPFCLYLSLSVNSTSLDRRPESALMFLPSKRPMTK